MVEDDCLEYESLLWKSAQDYMTLAAAVAHRHARHDASEQVRVAANRLLSLLESPPDLGASHSKSQIPEAATAVLPAANERSPTSVAQATPDLSKSLQLLTKLVAQPMLDFEAVDSVLKEAISATEPRPQRVACTPEPQQSDSLLRLESESPELGSPLEFDVAEFLRGSILPNQWEEHQAEAPRSMTTTSSDVFDELSAEGAAIDGDETSLASGAFFEASEDSAAPGMGDPSLASSWPSHPASQALPGLGICRSEAALLIQAIDNCFGGVGELPPSFSAQEIESVLHEVLELHSAAAYDYHTAAAEAQLERESVKLTGHADPATALEQKAKRLEAKVHLAVAQAQGVFLDEAVPRMANVLASPELLSALEA